MAKKKISEMTDELYRLAKDFEVTDGDWKTDCTLEEFTAVMWPDTDAQGGLTREEYQEAIDAAWKRYSQE